MSHETENMHCMKVDDNDDDDNNDDDATTTTLMTKTELLAMIKSNQL